MPVDQPTTADLSAHERVSCVSCHFSREFRNPQNPLAKFSVCKLFPSVPAFMPTNQGPAMFGSQQPQVVKPQWCHQWVPRRAGVVYDDELPPLIIDLLSESNSPKIPNI